LDARQIGMENGDLSDEITHLEARIEELAEAADRCRKFALASRVAIAVGGLLMAATAIGAIRFDPAAMIGALAAVIGGVVLYGSNATTAQQVTDAAADAEAQRVALIGRLELRVVGERAAGEER
jgi:hypothetical protein